MNDSLGNRMKENYENRTRFYLPRRTYVIIRLDGKAFHSFTKPFDKPFDEVFINLLNLSTINLLKQIDGAQFAYLQSDEVSVLLTDFTTKNTNAWFDNNIQKICSVSASVLTAEFNALCQAEFTSQSPFKNKLAYFDSRVFSIPDPVEVYNYFVWRQKDWTKNSIQAAAQSLYSNNELKNKKCNDLQEMIFQKGINWNNYETHIKRGRIIKRAELGWKVDNEIPIFTQSEYLNELIPAPGY